MMQKGAFFDTLWQYMTSKAERVPKNKPGPFHTDVSVYKTPPASGLRITWMGHSSLLIEIDGKRILTDPVWNRASFVSFAGPERFFAAPLALQNMPPLDAIIISHDHYDHFDEKTIKILAQTNTPFYCSVGVGPYLQKWGVAKQLITEMDWSDSAMIGDDCKLTATPARHFSGRGIVNRSTTLWSSFVIKGNKHNIFFGADSGWFPGFKDIGDAFGPFDLTMVEIGAYNKNWADIHMGPVNATEAHLALRGKVMMPIHWGTFNLALHPWREPVELLQEAALQKNITLLLPEPGMPTEVPATGYNSKWWEKY
jgi:L-ascorbate metabolism protein UlaG (beta-lactamase superfamily)